MFMVIAGVISKDLTTGTIRTEADHVEPEGEPEGQPVVPVVPRIKMRLLLPHQPSHPPPLF